jgi:hypothetical protein
MHLDDIDAATQPGSDLLTTHVITVACSRIDSYKNAVFTAPAVFENAWFPFNLISQSAIQSKIMHENPVGFVGNSS